MLRGRLPQLELLGLDPAATDLRVLSELFETEPTVSQELEATAARAEGISVRTDTRLEFGSLTMERGTAFREEDPGACPGGPTVPVTKRRWQTEGRDFLEESAAFEDLEPWLEALPEAGFSPELMDRARHTAGWRSTPPAILRGERPAGVDRIARAEVSRRLGPLGLESVPGVIRDWSLVTSVSNHTFKSDTTYYVSSAVTLTGTVTFEGGTVIKYSPGGTAELSLPDTVALKWEEPSQVWGGSVPGGARLYRAVRAWADSDLRSPRAIGSPDIPHPNRKRSCLDASCA